LPWRFPDSVAARALLTTTVAYGVLEAGSRVLQAMAVFLLAYWFEKSEFGEFYTYLSLYQLVTVLGTGGLMESLMHRVTRSMQAGASEANPVALYVRAYGKRAAGGVTLLFGLTVLLESQGGTSLDLTFVAVALAAGALNGLIVLLAANFTYAGQNRRSIMLRSTYSLLSYSLALGIAYASSDILLYFWGQLAASVLLTAAALWRQPTALVRPQAGALPVGADGSGWFIAPALLNWFFWYGLVVCVSLQFGAAEAANLAFANNIAQGLHIINLAVTQAWVSRYLRHSATSRATAEAGSASVFRLQSVVMVVAAIGIAFTYEFLRALSLPLLVKYGDIGLPLAILLFAISASSNYFGAVNAFAVNGQGRSLAAITLFAYLASLAVLVPAALGLGMLGVYIGMATLIMSRGFATAWYAKRQLSAGFFDLRLIVANALIFTVFAAYYLR
jgi:O-antigen/teichoic acid export membrane protein